MIIIIMKEHLILDAYNYSAPPLTRNASRSSLWAVRGASHLARPMNSQKSSGE